MRTKALVVGECFNWNRSKTLHLRWPSSTLPSDSSNPAARPPKKLLPAPKMSRGTQKLLVLVRKFYLTCYINHFIFICGCPICTHPDTFRGARLRIRTNWATSYYDPAASPITDAKIKELVSGLFNASFWYRKRSRKYWKRFFSIGTGVISISTELSDTKSLTSGSKLNVEPSWAKVVHLEHNDPSTDSIMITFCLKCIKFYILGWAHREWSVSIPLRFGLQTW